MSYKPTNFNLARLFKIPYEHWISIVYIFGKELHQTYSDVCSMPYFEIEMILETFKKDLEKQKEQNEKENESYQAQFDETRSMMSSISSSIPNSSQPNISNFNIPNISIPNI